MTRMTAGLVTAMLALAPAGAMAQGTQDTPPTSPDTPSMPKDTSKQGAQPQGTQTSGAQNQATKDLGIVAVELNADARTELLIPTDQGVLVAQVDPGSPASKSGLKPGDVVIAIADQPIADKAALDQALTSNAGESKVSMDVMRNGKQKELSARMKGQKKAQPQRG